MQTALVELKGVTKAYQLGETQVDALKGIDLTLNAGEFTALVGASGSGKSTLLNIIGCIDDADAGTVLLDKIDIKTLNETRKAQIRNRKLGFVFQSFNLVPVLTASENVELPLFLQKEIPALERAARVKSALESVGLQNYANHLPDKLSGGQRQRVAIARALVTRPRLVIADEPTANLDSATANQLVDLLLELNQKQGVTFLFSTHDEKLMNRVNRIVRIQDGVLQP